VLVKAFFPKSKKLVNVTAMANETPDNPNACGEDAPETETGVAQASSIPGAAPGKALSPEAVRALMEAEARRQAAPKEDMPVEINGRREGEEPTRYGDWEKKGLAVDF
jgi:hypothetical protein